MRSRCPGQPVNGVPVDVGTDKPHVSCALCTGIGDGRGDGQGGGFHTQNPGDVARQSECEHPETAVKVQKSGDRPGLEQLAGKADHLFRGGGIHLGKHEG